MFLGIKESLGDVFSIGLSYDRPSKNKYTESIRQTCAFPNIGLLSIEFVARYHVSGRFLCSAIGAGILRRLKRHHGANRSLKEYAMCQSRSRQWLHLIIEGKAVEYEVKSKRFSYLPCARTARSFSECIHHTKPHRSPSTISETLCR